MDPLPSWDAGYWDPLFGLLQDGAEIQNSVDDSGGSTWVSEGSSCFWIDISYFPKPEVDSGRIDPGYSNPVCITVDRNGTISNQVVY